MSATPPNVDLLDTKLELFEKLAVYLGASFSKWYHELYRDSAVELRYKGYTDGPGPINEYALHNDVLRAMGAAIKREGVRISPMFYCGASIQGSARFCNRLAIPGVGVCHWHGGSQQADHELLQIMRGTINGK